MNLIKDDVVKIIKIRIKKYYSKYRFWRTQYISTKVKYQKVKFFHTDPGYQYLYSKTKVQQETYKSQILKEISSIKKLKNTDFNELQKHEILDYLI